jgi:DNA-binding LytR/AlgR family response regulator
MNDNLCVLVADDEPLALEKLTSFLRAERPNWTLWLANDGAQALELLRLHPRFDACFMDVEMPHASGIGVLQRSLKENGGKTAWVFITGHSQFAVDAFEEGVTDYLMKPFTRARLIRAIERVEATCMDSPLIAIHSSRSTRWIPAQSVQAFISREKLTWVKLDASEFPIEGSLLDWEARLLPHGFIRIHRSALVNLRFLRKSKTFASHVTLADGTNLAVSRNSRRTLAKLAASIEF